jgi:hypothetical protein
MRNGKMETAWFVVSDQALTADPAQLRETNWWRAVAEHT